MQILISSLLPEDGMDNDRTMRCQGRVITEDSQFAFDILMRDDEVLTPARIPQELEDSLDASLEFDDAETAESGPCVVLLGVGKLYLRFFDPSVPRIEGRLIMTCSDYADFDLCCEAGNVCSEPEGFYGDEQQDICRAISALLAENGGTLPIYCHISDPETA